tara:strand:+ start:192 stop:461 length:270 start_codon:yes stop_codon:yes gene_type:complete
MDCQGKPNFLSVKTGDYVAIKPQYYYASSRDIQNYWIGRVIYCIGGARDPHSWTLFQVINIDNDEVQIINADTVKMILTPKTKVDLLHN